MNWVVLLLFVVPASLSFTSDDPCLRKCMSPLLSLSKRVEMRPLYPVLSDATLDEARTGMEEICRTILNQTKCMKGCPAYDLKTAMAMHPAHKRCTKDGSDTILKVLECQISTRKQVQEECGLEKMEEFAQISNQLSQLLAEARINPLKAATQNFKDTFGDACSYASDLTSCMVGIYREACSYEARDAILTSLTTLLGTEHAMEGVSAIHPHCSDMMSIFAQLEQAWTTRKTTPAPTTPGKKNEPASLVLGNGTGTGLGTKIVCGVLAMGLIILLKLGA